MDNTNTSTSQNGNGTSRITVNDAQLDKALKFIANNLLSRQNFLTGLQDQRRNIAHDCGYPEDVSTISAEDYQTLYDTEPIPARVVEVLPKESWQVQPSVYEEEDPTKTTPFEEAWDNLPRSLAGDSSYYQDEYGSAIWDYLLRADICSGIGHYGIILLGIDDGLSLDQPAKFVRYQGEGGMAGRGKEGGGRNGNGNRPNRNLRYIRVFSEVEAPIGSYESDPSSPRFMQPLEYNITFNYISTVGGVGAGIGVKQATKTVHWSRVIHVADNLRSSELFGIPRMRPVLRRLKDLEKIYSASGEAYYKNAFLKLFFGTDPQLGGEIEFDRNKMRDVLENMLNGSQQWGAFPGWNVNPVAPAVVDPNPQVSACIEAICIQLGIPIRVFKGSERGELASSQDDAAWNDRLRSRQNFYLTPRIVCPFIDRLIALGVLPAPGSGGSVQRAIVNARQRGRIVRNVRGGYVIHDSATSKNRFIARAGYSVWWPDLTSQTDAEKANLLLVRTQALTTFIGGNGEAAMTLMDWYTREAGYTDEEAEAILEASAKEQEEKEAEALLAEEEAQQMGGEDAQEEEAPDDEEDVLANAFCPTGEGGGHDNSCSSKKEGSKKISAKHRKILDFIDKELIRRNREFFRTRGEKEREFGFKLVPPTEVDWNDIPKATYSDLEDLVSAGLLEKRSTSLGVKVKRTGLPEDYYHPGEGVSNVLSEEDIRDLIANTEESAIPKPSVEEIIANQQRLLEILASREEKGSEVFVYQEPPIINNIVEIPEQPAPIVHNDFVVEAPLPSPAPETPPQQITIPVQVNVPTQPPPTIVNEVNVPTPEIKEVKVDANVKLPPKKSEPKRIRIQGPDGDFTGTIRPDDNP